MKIADDKAAQYGKKIFWWGIILIIILALYQCADRAITRFSPGAYQTQRGYMENGYWVPDVPFTIGPETRAKTYWRELLEGREFEMVTDCRKIDEYVVTIPPRKTAQIRHIDYGPYEPQKSSCSYGFGNYRAPVNGPHARMVARPRFEENFFFPDIPPLVTAFYTTDASGRGKTPEYIKKLGGSIFITNPTDEAIEIHLQKNLTHALYDEKLDRDGIGYDGSTEKFHITIFDPI